MQSEDFPFTRAATGALTSSHEHAQTKLRDAKDHIKCIQTALSGAMRVAADAQEKIKGFQKQLADVAAETRHAVHAAVLDQGNRTSSGVRSHRRMVPWKLVLGILALLVSIYGFIFLFVKELKEYRIKGLDSEEALWSIAVGAFAVALMLFALAYRDRVTAHGANAIRRLA